MEGFTDIHSHIMPGVDDGSRDWDESILMLRMAEKENIRKIILTPHQKPDHSCVSVNGIEKRISKLQEELERQHIPIELYTGSELFYSHDLAERLQSGSVCTMAGSHYILVEFMPDESWAYIRDGLYQLISRGYWPIVAHVERYVQVMQDTERVSELIDMGCYIQVNAGSLAGDWGLGVKRLARKLVKKKLVHFLGTDAHRGEGRRAPRFKKCADWLCRKDAEYADALLWKNAEHIFSDKEL